jgi:hypothetical protein
MNEAVPWLPSSALGDARTAEPVARALAEWSAAWLVTGAITVPPRWEVCDIANGPMGYVSANQGEDYRLLLREDTTFDLAALLLGREIGERECRTGCDRVVIQHLVEVALAALAETLANILKQAGGDRSDNWYALPIGWNGVSLLRVEATRSVLVAIVREWAGPARRGMQLAPRRAGLVGQPVSLSAQIGTSRLALAEIEALEIGDVLTLDTPLSAPITACIDGRCTGNTAFSLTRVDGNLNLQIERPASQW